MKTDLDLLNRFLIRAEREPRFKVYKPILRASEAFSLDDDTVEVIAEMASGAQRHKMMPLYRELAMLPFDHVWLEFDYHCLHRWREQRDLLGQDTDRHINGVPTRMGFLCERLVRHPEGFRVTTVGWMPPSKGDPPAACVFALCHNVTTGRDKVVFTSHRHDLPEIAQIVETINRGPWPAFAWGMDGGSVTPREWVKHPLQGTNGLEPEGVFTDVMFAKHGKAQGLDEIARAMAGGFVGEQRGDLRFVVAALALLNHVPVVYKPYKPRGRMLASGTTKPFIESRVVSVDVPASRKRIKIIDRELRNSLALQRRKRHRVRGHWRVSERSHGDRWEAFTDPFTLSRRWRIWIADHERGDASLGWVDHSYGVHGRAGALAAVGLDSPLQVPDGKSAT